MLIQKNTLPNELLWDDQWLMYNQNPYFKPNFHILKIISQLFHHNLKNKKILELGAGSGSDIVYLAKKGAVAYALDFSQKSLDSIKYWAKKKKVKVTAIKGDIQKLPFDANTFDLVYSVGLMEHFQNTQPLLKQQMRIIRPGGFLIVDVPQKYTCYTLAKHLRMRLGTHPFGWETEFSQNDLTQLARKLGQKPYCFYGREVDILNKIIPDLNSQLKHTILSFIEPLPIAPAICLCIGLVIKKH
ncbi:MAG: class I SAM-dependent methyltransferase [Patescibacteria group bacterium]